MPQKRLATHGNYQLVLAVLFICIRDKNKLVQNFNINYVELKHAYLNLTTKLRKMRWVIIRGQTLRVLKNDGTEKCLSCFASIQRQWIADEMLVEPMIVI